jgi:hypothetical protein
LKMAKAKSGGGATMNKNVKTPIKSGSPNTRAVSPSAVGRIGIKQGNHRTDGGTMKPPADPLVKAVKPQVPSGNQVALNVGRGGPGAGRTVHSTGSQGQHGSAVPGIAPVLTPGGGPTGMGFPGKGGK